MERIDGRTVHLTDEEVAAQMEYQDHLDNGLTIGQAIIETRPNWPDLDDRFWLWLAGEPRLSGNPLVDRLQVMTPEGPAPVGFYVAVYALGREYGGPEEGGWWFDTGDLVLCVPCFSKEEAEETGRRLMEKYPYTGKSSNYHGGEDYAVEIKEEPPSLKFPLIRPHYE